MKKPPSGGGRYAEAATDSREATISIEDYSPVIIGLIVVLALWLAFTVVRKLFGLALLAAVGIGAWMLWNDPQMLYSAVDAVSDAVGR